MEATTKELTPDIVHRILRRAWQAAADTHQKPTLLAVSQRIWNILRYEETIRLQEQHHTTVSLSQDGRYVSIYGCRLMVDMILEDSEVRFYAELSRMTRNDIWPKELR